MCTGGREVLLKGKRTSTIYTERCCLSLNHEVTILDLGGLTCRSSRHEDSLQEGAGHDLCTEGGEGLWGGKGTFF